MSDAEYHVECIQPTKTTSGYVVDVTATDFNPWISVFSDWGEPMGLEVGQTVVFVVTRTD